MSAPGNKVGGVDLALLEKVVEGASETISVANAGTRETFLDAWSRRLADHARHLRSQGKSLTAPFVISHVPDAGEFLKSSQWNKRSTLGISHLEGYAGCLAAGTGEVGGCVCPTALATMGEFEAALLAAGLGGAPTVGLMSETKLVIWPHGIECEGDLLERELDADKMVVDLDLIDEELDAFYAGIGRQSNRWWLDAEKRITVPGPELEVQYDLWVFLYRAFLGVALVKQEILSGNGRADVTIVPLPRKAAQNSKSAVLELKTLRDFRTPRVKGSTPTKISFNDNVGWACSGVQQTAGYRDMERLDGAFLCLYDFREDESDAMEKAVQPHADKHGVLSRRYRITNSNKEHRVEQYPLAAKSD